MIYNIYQIKAQKVCGERMAEQEGDLLCKHHCQQYQPHGYWKLSKDVPWRGAQEKKSRKKSQALPACFFVTFSFSTFSSVQSLSPVWLCDPMNRSTPGLPVYHQLPEFTQTHVHGVGDAIQPSHPLSSPSPPAPNPSQHQGHFQWDNSSHQVAKVLEFQLHHQSFQWTPKTDLLLQFIFQQIPSPVNASIETKKRKGKAKEKRKASKR